LSRQPAAAPLIAGPLRTTLDILTDQGFQTIADTAPGHVAHVRSILIDVLSPEQLRRLGRDADRIVSRIDRVRDQPLLRRVTRGRC
jgi:small neutral amino acid transporter SnatA (MarC family)